MSARVSGRGLLACSLAVLLSSLTLRAQSTKTQTLLLEAEDFSVTRGEWKKIGLGENYYAATLANTFISRQKLLSAPEQGQGEVEFRAEIPASGEYRIWTRYECPSWWSIEHTLRIEQNGKKVFERKYGAVENPKLWPFGKGMQPMVEWDWGSGDNVVWESSSEAVHLEAGAATFILIAERQPTTGPKQRGAARRNIDCIFLTTDLEEGFRDAKKSFYSAMDRHLNQAGECFLRISNLGGTAIHAQLRVAEHNPYWQKRGPTPEKIGARGEFKGAPQEQDWIERGGSSRWVAIGQALDSSNMQELYVRFAGRESSTNLAARIELGADSTGARILLGRDFTAIPRNEIIFEVPGDLRHGSSIATIEDWHGKLQRVLQEHPARLPKRVPIFGILGGSWGSTNQESELYRLRTETALLLGRNTCRPGELPEDMAGHFNIAAQPNLEIDVRGTPTEKLAAELAKHELKAQIRYVSMGDEIGVGGYEAENPKQQQGFREYLERLRSMPEQDRQREYAIYSDLPDPSQARLTKDSSDAENFYWSQLFQIDRGIDDLKARTAIVEKTLGTNVFTGANYAPHPHYWPRAGQWVRLFRRHGMTMPWSEDWIFQIPEASMQMSGYLCDVMRCAAKYGNGPIQLYTMPHYPGQTARDLELSFCSALGHGNKIINFFAAKPIYEYTENYIGWEGVENWRAVQRLVNDVAQADEIIADGKIPQAQVAILMSHLTDIHEEARGSSIFNFERKNLYYAIRQSGYPVDFLSEEDVCEGWLDGANQRGKAYHVLYVCGDHMIARCAERVAKWVKEGGRLFSVAGGGLLNEKNQTNSVLLDVFGIRGGKLVVTEKNLWAKEGLAWVKPLDIIKPWKFPALIARQEFISSHPASARFANDATAAVIDHPLGRGTATIVGTFPGSRYMQAAIPQRPFDRGTSDQNFNHFIPTRFDEEARKIIIGPIRACGREISPNVTTSEPLVDAGLVESKQGYAIALANYSGKDRVTVRVKARVSGAVRSVFSSRAGELRFDKTGEGVEFSETLGAVDLIILRPQSRP